jgi:hypothetical protein
MKNAEGFTLVIDSAHVVSPVKRDPDTGLVMLDRRNPPFESSPGLLPGDSRFALSFEDIARDNRVDERAKEKMRQAWVHSGRLHYTRIKEREAYTKAIMEAHGYALTEYGYRKHDTNKKAEIDA